MHQKTILTAGAIAITLTLSLHMVPAQAQEQTTQGQTRAERQATREQRLGRILPADRVIGREVVARNGNKIGSIDDAVLDFETGRILFMVLNLAEEGANNRVAVPPMLFTVASAPAQQGAQGRQPFGLEVGRQAVAGAPKFDRDQPESMASAAFLDKVYRHFNQPTWWAGAAGSTAGEFKNVHRASRMSEFAVHDVANANLGKMHTALLDVPAGRVAYGILDPAKRVTEKQELIPVPPMAFTKGTEKRMLILDANQEKLDSAPKVDRQQLTGDNLRQLADPQFAQRVYEYWGKKVWFDQNTLSPTGAERGRPENNN